jgi:hypothetical protein
LEKELTPEEILELVLKLPQSANPTQVCDLIVNIVIAYNMNDDFALIAAMVHQMLNEINVNDVKITIH